MNDEAGATVSLWHATSKVPAFEPLRSDTHAEVCIVGGGIAGVSTAYELARRGRDVVLLDDGEIGGGATGRTTAHLATGLDDRYYALARLHGEDGARLAAQSHAAAIDFIEEASARHAIACSFQRVPGYLVAAPGRPASELSDECIAARDAGLDASLVDEAGVAAKAVGTALRFPQQAQVHPLRYLYGLAAACVREGVRIHTRTHADAVVGGSGAHVGCGNLRVSCDAIVVATNTPVNDRVAIHTKQAPYRTYVIAMPIAPDAFKPCLLWETGDPYHYVRCWRDDGGDTWLIVGGEDHKTGQPGEPVDRFARLRAWTRDHLGIDGAIGHAWSGQVQEPHDGLGFIGRNPSDEDNVFVATGDSGNGMTHGTLAALLIADLIEGRGSPWEALYSPSRQMVRAASDYLRENANVAVQYGDLVTGGDVDDVEAIAIGSGAIIRRGTSKHAVYRDGAGTLHAHSAICPHLGCVVQWNGIEKTWDCPCHGSRFRAEDGRVIMGPANHPLGPAAVE